MHKLVLGGWSALKDLKAGIVVFLVALPLCLGVALAQQAPLFSGIVAGVIGGVVVTLLSGSKYSVSGPAAGLTAIVAAGIVSMSKFEYFLTALFLAGVIQLFFGMLKAGVVAHYFPSSVIKGMLSAIGIILIMKQLPHLIGDDMDGEGDFSFFQANGENSFTELYEMVFYAKQGPLLIGIISLLMMFFLSSKKIQKIKWMQYFPIPLLVVVMAISLNLFSKHNYPLLEVRLDHMVLLPQIHSFSDLVENLHFPDFSMVLDRGVLLLALTIAVVASIETLLNLDAVDKLDPDKNISPPNRELCAQGVGNMICGLIGGIPITSVIVRSSANVNAGAHSKKSSIVHGLLLLFSVLLIPGILSMIPLAALAAILIYTGYKLTHIGLIKSVYKAGMSQFLPFITTVSVMLMTDILKGIAAGMVVSVFYILKFNLKTPYKVASTTIHGRYHTLITLSEDVTFLNKARFYEELLKVKDDSTLIIDGTNNKTIDLDIVEMVSDYSKKIKDKNIELDLINFNHTN